MEKIVSFLSEKLNRRSDRRFIFPGGSGFIKDDLFLDVPNSRDGIITFVDGGMGRVFDAPGLGVYFIRIASVCFRYGQKKISMEEGYCLIWEEDKYIHGKMVDLNGGEWFKEIKINCNDGSMVSKHDSISAEAMAGYCRRIAEFNFAGKYGEGLVIMDGSLFCPTVYELELRDSVHRLLKEKRASLNSVAKSCKWTTMGGEPINLALQKIIKHSNKSSFCYGPIHRQGMISHIVKFSERSNMTLVVDCIDFEESLLPLLSLHAEDAAFLGYPYGLVLVDQIARVGNSESEAMREQFISLLNDKSLTSYASFYSAHDVLDS